MDIHKAKSVHAWHELLREIGVIVIGVLIALGAQQAVDQLHWANEVRKARISLRHEMDKSDRVFAYRVGAEPCIARRLDALEAVVERTSRHEPVGRLGPVIPDIGNALNDSDWQNHRSSQTLTHFDDDELDLLGLYYLQITNFRTFMGNEADAWGVIKVLQGDPARLGPIDIAGIRVAIQHARFDNGLLASIAADQLARSKRLHIPPPVADAARLREVCGPRPQVS
jgi:hypothetical protein